jgi:hypothetical protein
MISKADEFAKHRSGPVPRGIARLIIGNSMARTCGNNGDGITVTANYSDGLIETASPGCAEREAGCAAPRRGSEFPRNVRISERTDALIKSGAS